jgi:hypothetical protein
MCLGLVEMIDQEHLLLQCLLHGSQKVTQGDQERLGYKKDCIEAAIRKEGDRHQSCRGLDRMN